MITQSHGTVTNMLLAMVKSKQNIRGLNEKQFVERPYSNIMRGLKGIRHGRKPRRNYSFQVYS